MKDGKPGTQSNNTVEGDLAGGNIHKTVNIQNIGAPRKSRLRQIAEETKQKAASDSDYAEFIDSLNHYAVSIDDGPVIGLEGKLQSGGRDDLLAEALRCKELFAQKLYRNQPSEQMQILFVNVLAKINTVFDHKIKPLIIAGDSNASISAAILDELIEPLFDDIGGTELRITHDEIRGMLYFLTGNCHINWH